MTGNRSRFILGFILAAPIGFSSTGCHLLPGAPEVSNNRYIVEVRCHTQDGSPIPNVRIENPESGASGFTDNQGKLSFRLEGHDGAEVTLKVESAPEGIVVATEKNIHRLVLKSIDGAAANGRKGFLSHDILMRKTHETYVVLVSTEGAPDLPVTLNGVTAGRLNSRGAGAFRFYGQPGEELKILLDITGHKDRLSTAIPQKTIILPQNSAILTFHSGLIMNSDNTVSEPPAPVVEVAFSSRSRRKHRKADRIKKVEVVEEKSKSPRQVPFRDIDLKKP